MLMMMVRFHPRRVGMYSLGAVCYAVFLIILKYNIFHFVSNEKDEWIYDIENNSGASEEDPLAKKPLFFLTEINHSITNIWNCGNNKWNDRILAQVHFVPSSYDANTSPMKYIYVPAGVANVGAGQWKFKEDACLVDRCSLTASSDDVSSADAVLLQNDRTAVDLPRSPGQIWILWLLESPMNSVELDWLQQGVNWTATYRADSTIVTPYEKFVPHLNVPEKSAKNFAEGKTKLVAWFVSNCHSSNQRLEYTINLQKYITVDIFGYCGSKRCPREAKNTCDSVLKTDYKFYLAFENSNCEYYITEKLFWNALLNDIVPVVMGARTLDYLHAAPLGSYIHVEDFKTPRHLANYLHHLDKNDTLYNAYFRWKGTGEFINTKFWCRLCAMLHDQEKPQLWVQDVQSWWRGNGSCTRDRWDIPNDVIVKWSTDEYDYEEDISIEPPPELED